MKLTEKIKSRIFEIIHFMNLKNRNENCDIINFYSYFIQKNDLCFDVGANFGKKTDAFLKLGAKVVCIEPQTSCFKMLNDIFGKKDDVIIIHKGLAELEGFLELKICEDNPTISTMSTKWKENGRFSKDHKWSKTEKVPVTTLDRLIEEYGSPKFCKIDVEGFEYNVLKGLTKPIPYISFEFTKEFFEDTKRCIAYLLSIGHAEFNCSIGESYQLLFSSWVSAEELNKKIEFIQDNLLWGDIYVKF